MRKLFMLALVWPLAVAATDGSYEAALAEFDRGEYTVAHRELLPYAEAGNAEAQYRLGWMYEHAKGVWGDDKEALKWYRLAAGQGHVVAQLRAIATQVALNIEKLADSGKSHGPFIGLAGVLLLGIGTLSSLLILAIMVVHQVTLKLFPSQLGRAALLWMRYGRALTVSGCMALLGFFVLWAAIESFGFRLN
jgi:TPR repeat protein